MYSHRWIIPAELRPRTRVKAWRKPNEDGAPEHIVHKRQYRRDVAMLHEFERLIEMAK